jgi:antirestriction protein ArdC
MFYIWLTPNHLLPLPKTDFQRSPSLTLEHRQLTASSQYLCAEAGISPAVLENQAAYLQGWLAALRGNKRLIVTAAAQAQRAADYIRNADSNPAMSI